MTEFAGTINLTCQSLTENKESTINVTLGTESTVNVTFGTKSTVNITFGTVYMQMVYSPLVRSCN